MNFCSTFNKTLYLLHIIQTTASGIALFPVFYPHKTHLYPQIYWICPHRFSKPKGRQRVRCRPFGSVSLGADRENRTPDSSLARTRFTTKPYPLAHHILTESTRFQPDARWESRRTDAAYRLGNQRIIRPLLPISEEPRAPPHPTLKCLRQDSNLERRFRRPL